jgi:outer membrane protein, heavy metal efflux system
MWDLGVQTPKASTISQEIEEIQMFAKKSKLMLAALLLPASLCAQQSPLMSQQEMQMHHHMDIPPVEPLYPRLGRPQEQAKNKLFTLEDAQRIAADSNPTLRQAEAQIRAAKARIQQAGLYPNPTVGYAGDEIRGGSIDGGKQGFFAQQTIVTGGKLAKGRTVFEQESRVAELEAEEQETRVQTAVKIAFYRVLAAQELLELRRDLSQIALMYKASQDQLMQTGQVDESEKLDTDIEVQRVHLAAFEQENVVREEWRRLAAILGQPDLLQSTVAGDLEHGWPEIDEEQILSTIAQQSPATHIADAAASRASSETIRAKSQVIPDLSLLGGFEYNNEPLGSTPPHAIGWEGFAEVGVQLPIFNRNQGNIAEAGAELDRAQLEKQRIQLVLRARAASILDEYATAKVIATQYRDSILPTAKKANQLLTEKYGQMLAAYPRMLEARRKNFQLELEYVRTLQTVWTTSLALQGFLLTDGLEAPARPSDVDRPMRETNLPMPEPSTPSPEQMFVP